MVTKVSKPHSSNIRKSQIEIKLEPLSKEMIISEKKDWVLLKLTIPIEVREWLDTNKKNWGITYSKFFQNMLLENIYFKQIISKLINNTNLSNEEIDFLKNYSIHI